MISIIVTYYNTGWMIGRCLESISMQTYDNYEVVLIDNGSTDKSKMDVDDVMKNCKLKNCHYYYINHTSTNAAINYGLDLVQGEYVLIMDGYDFLNINTLHYYYWGMISGNADMVIGDFEEVRYNTKMKDITATPVDYNLLIIGPDKMIERMHTPTLHADLRYNHIWNKLYKTSLFDNYRLTDDMGCEITAIKDLVLKCDTIALASFVLYYRSMLQNVKLDLTISDAYKERIEYLKEHCGETTVRNAQYLYLTNLVDIYKRNREPKLHAKCADELVEAYESYHDFIPATSRADLITRIYKNILTKRL